MEASQWYRGDESSTDPASITHLSEAFQLLRESLAKLHCLLSDEIAEGAEDVVQSGDEQVVDPRAVNEEYAVLRQKGPVKVVDFLFPQTNVIQFLLQQPNINNNVLVVM